MNKTIESALAKYPKARKIAVENFTFGKIGKGMSMEDAMNLESDARAYAWKPDTVKAIKYLMAKK
jgi:hypothetical protein